MSKSVYGGLIALAAVALAGGAAAQSSGIRVSPSAMAAASSANPQQAEINTLKQQVAELQQQLAALQQKVGRQDNLPNVVAQLQTRFASHTHYFKNVTLMKLPDHKEWFLSNQGGNVGTGQPINE